MADTKSTGNGIGLLTVLFLIFMVLKLTGHIDWSWWWVTAPLWGGVTAAVTIILLCGLFIGLASIFEKKGR